MIGHYTSGLFFFERVCIELNPASLHIPYISNEWPWISPFQIPSMQALRPTSAFAWLIAFHLHASHSNAYEVKYGIPKMDYSMTSRIKEIVYCQACLRNAGVTTISLFTFTRARSIFSTTVSSPLIEKRVQMHCNCDLLCPGLYRYPLEE